jgi:hypothetical protein
MNKKVKYPLLYEQCEKYRRRERIKWIKLAALWIALILVIVFLAGFIHESKIYNLRETLIIK